MSSGFNLVIPKKVCSCCNQSLPITEFYKQSYTDKLTDQCKTCINVKRSVQRNKSKHGKFISKERIRAMEEPNYQLKDWKDVMVYFGGECPFCGTKEGRSKKAKFDRDHLVAISCGGKTERKNIIPCCPKCNRGRGNKDWVEWFRKQPFWTQEREDKIREWVRRNEASL